jgi:uncharacterized membrane protein
MHDLWLVLHFIGLAMGVGANFISVGIALSTSRLSIEERMSLMPKISVIAKIGSFGLLLILLSGVFLLLPMWPSLKTNGLLHVKLTLVLLLLITFGLSQMIGKRLRTGKAPQLAKWMPRIGMINSVLVLSIIAVAVWLFH